MARLRTAAHVHSSWSYDAELSLAEIAREFRRRKYDVVLMSEHDRSFSRQRWTDYQQACREASTDAITLIPGIEYEDADGVVHIPVWGDGIPFLGAGRPTLDLLRSARAEGAIAVLAHPWRRNAIGRYRPEWAELLTAVEVWNRKYDGIAPNRKSAELAASADLVSFVSLDFHASSQFFPLAMSVELDDRVSPASLAQALRPGRYRAEFLGLPALRFTGGIEGATLRALEGGRRGARHLVRRLSRNTVRAGMHGARGR